jgi:hypothetical protein
MNHNDHPTHGLLPLLIVHACRLAARRDAEDAPATAQALEERKLDEGELRALRVHAHAALEQRPRGLDAAHNRTELGRRREHVRRGRARVPLRAPSTAHMHSVRSETYPAQRVPKSARAPSSYTLQIHMTQGVTSAPNFLSAPSKTTNCRRTSAQSPTLDDLRLAVPRPPTALVKRGQGERTEAGDTLAAERLESGLVRDIREKVGRARRAPDERALERRPLLHNLLHLVLHSQPHRQPCASMPERTGTHTREEPARDEVLQLREHLPRASSRQCASYRSQGQARPAPTGSGRAPCRPSVGAGVQRRRERNEISRRLLRQIVHSHARLLCSTHDDE